MSIKKRVISALSLVLCLFMLTVPAFAADTDTEEPEQIVPELTLITGCINRLSSNGNTAKAYAYVTGNASTTTKCEVKVKLQVKSWLIWTTVETWQDTQYSSRAEISETYRMTSGKSYRAVATVTVWSGTESESRTLTSGTVTA